MKEKVLNIFKRNGNKKLDPIEIVKYLSKDYDVKDIKEVMDVIYELVSDGSIVSCKKGMFKLTGDEYVKGKVERVGSGNGYLLQSDGDIYIDKKNMNTALTGDLCLCEIFKRFGSTEAKVKKVLDRNLPLGEIVEDSGIVYVKPLKEYPYELELLYNKEFSLVDGEIVKLKCIEENNKVLKVKVIKKIGHKNSPDIDTLKIMAELDVPAGFSEETMNEVKTLPTEVLKSDYKGRTDISNEMIFTIDGKDTKDIDDAVGLKMLDNGNYLLNVSIADVTNYVKWNSSIFNDAYNKGNSTYMADKVEPMLPIELSNGICSLNPNVLRCAVTTEIEFDTNGNVVNKRMYPSIIKSRKKMNYDDVNIILKGGHVSGYEEFESTLLNMLELSKKLKKKKLERGEIEFPSDEIKLIVDENGKVIDIKKRVQDLGENLIEEFMIASNEASIDLLTNECEYGIYRVHAKPAPKKIEDFVKFMSSLGYSTKGKFNYSDISNKNIQMILNEIKGVKDEDILSRKLLRSMQKAVYSTDNIGHFGLGSKKYTHETSPIRRFSDLLLHYMIKIVLFKWNMGVSINEIGRGLVEACDHISMTERRSDECEYAVEDMKMAEYMEKHIGEEFKGMISSVTNFGMFVELENLIEGLVHITSLKGFYNYDETSQSLLGEKNGDKYTIGDNVLVKVVAASKEEKFIDFEIIKKL